METQELLGRPYQIARGWTLSVLVRLISSSKLTARVLRSPALLQLRFGTRLPRALTRAYLTYRSSSVVDMQFSIPA